MSIRKVIFIFTSLLFLILESSSGQKGFEIGPSVGLSYYFGDLNTEFDLSKPGLAGALNLRYNFNTRISIKLAGNYGRLRADDLDSENSFEFNRGINFKTHLLDISGQLELNFFPYVHGSAEHFVTPYLFVGVSQYFFDPTAEYNGVKYRLRELGTEGQFQGDTYSTSQQALNFGGGIKWALNEDWSVNFELSFRRLFTDYLDDVSTTYPNPDELLANGGSDALLTSNPSAVLSFPEIQGMQRGNVEDNDTYTFFQISFLKYFGNLSCPDISLPRQ